MSRQGVERGNEDTVASSDSTRITLIFTGLIRTQAISCTLDELEILCRRSEYFVTVFRNNVYIDKRNIITIPEEDATSAISFLVELLRDRSSLLQVLRWDENWVRMSIKWQTLEYIAAFSDIADKHIKLVVGSWNENKQLSSMTSVYFSSFGTEMHDYEDAIYDATDVYNIFGVQVYQKRNNTNKVIEFWAPFHGWVWKPRSHLGDVKGCIFQVSAVKQTCSAQPNITSVSTVRFATGCPAPADVSQPVNVNIVPAVSPPAPEPPLPSSADVELFWMMCEAILWYPALAKADGLIKSKEDLMAVLLKKRHLVEYRIMEKMFTMRDVFQIVFGLEYSSNKRSR